MKRTGIVIFAIIAALLGGAIVVIVEGSVEIRSGPGWNLTIQEDPVINPDTGEQYGSAAEFLEERAPERWNTMSPGLQAWYARQPAVRRRIDLTLTPTEEQRNRIRALSGRNLTEAEFYAAVYPDLWIVIPDWQKDIWANRTHSSGSHTGVSPAAVNSTSPSPAEGSQASGSGPGNVTEGVNGDRVPADPTDETRSRSGFSVDSGGNTSVSSTTTPAGTAARVSGAVGTISAFASAHSHSRSSILDYSRLTSVSGVIDHFGFSVRYLG